MRADNSHHLRAAARRRALATRQRAVSALRRLERAGGPVSFELVAREARVSRSWLYGQPDLRAAIGQRRATAAAGGGAPGPPPIPARQRASEASLRRRLEAAGAEIRRLRAENQQLREQLAWAHGERRAADGRGPTGPWDTGMGDSPSTIGPCS
jgi:predicted RNase H-like nuclease (RuvC/YqgF family)